VSLIYRCSRLFASEWVLFGSANVDCIERMVYERARACAFMCVSMHSRVGERGKPWLSMRVYSTGQASTEAFAGTGALSAHG
jgi:hypothetical protein